MSKKSTAIASLDIVAEGLAQQDGLAERLMRHRASKVAQPSPSEPVAPPPSETQSGYRAGDEPLPAAKNRNAWRQGKGLIQVPIPDEAHLELSIIAKRRRLQLTQLTRSALNLWLETHGHALRIPE